MNTNYDLRELLSATPRDEGQGLTPQYSFGVAFYYSFIFLHFFVLLNMVIAIVVDAYMGAKGDQETEIAKRLKKNMGPMFRSLAKDLHASFMDTWVSMRSSRALGGCLSSCFRKPLTKVFVPWQLEEWDVLVQWVHAARVSRGQPSVEVQLATLSREVHDVLHRALSEPFKYDADMVEIDEQYNVTRGGHAHNWLDRCLSNVQQRRQWKVLQEIVRRVEKCGKDLSKESLDQVRVQAR
jgi:hypothetical protein